MTDRFEEAVRDALNGLDTTTGDIPSYHGAWQRGRRRRIFKRSALTAVGALVFVAALAVNLGRVPGSGTTEVDDVAIDLAVATPVFEPTPLATTSPLESPDPSVGSAAAQALELPTPSTDDATPVPSAAPTVTPAPNAASSTDGPVAVPTATAQPAAPPTPAPPTVAPIPTEPAATAVPTPLPTPTTAVVPATPTGGSDQGSEQATQADGAATSIAPAESTSSNDQSSESGADDAAGTAQQPPDPEASEVPPSGPDLAFTSGAAADAVLLGGAARGVPLSCDIDGDALADATCELLVDYPCTGQGDVQPGYTATDIDGDQVNDTCVAVGITRCDTTFDGFGDTPCIINVTPTPAEESDEDG